MLKMQSSHPLGAPLAQHRGHPQMQAVSMTACTPVCRPERSASPVRGSILGGHTAWHPGGHHLDAAIEKRNLVGNDLVRPYLGQRIQFPSSAASTVACCACQHLLGAGWLCCSLRGMSPSD